MRTALPLPHSLWPQLIQALLLVWADVAVLPPTDAASTPSLSVCGRVTLRLSTAIPIPGVSSGTVEAQPAQPEVADDPRKRRKKAAVAAAAATPSTASATGAEDQHCVILEWSSGTVDDLIADSVAAVVCQCCVGPWAVLQQPRHHHQHHEHEDHHQKEAKAAPSTTMRPDAEQMLLAALAGQFEGVTAHKEGGVAVEGCRVVLGERGGVRITGDSSKIPIVKSVVDRLAANNLLTGIKANIH